MVIEELQLAEPIAAFNGGIFVNPRLENIACHRLNPTVASDVIHSLENGKLDVWIYTEIDWIVRNPTAPHV